MDIMTRTLGLRVQPELQENRGYRAQRGTLLWDPRDLQDHPEHRESVTTDAPVNRVHLDLRDLQENQR